MDTKDLTKSEEANTNQTQNAPTNPTDTSPAKNIKDSTKNPDQKIKQPTKVTTGRKSNQPSSLDFRSTIIVLVSIALVASACSFTYMIYDILRNDVPLTLLGDGTDGNSANFTEGSIAEIASKVAPGVVSIVTETRTTSWFGSDTATSAGTGMIISQDGYVLTNKHVVDGANTISVVLDDGTTFTNVKLIGSDPLNDVAFLKIDNANNLPTVTLGDSKTLTAGQQVIAIGNALGQYQNTITAGVISGTGRSLIATDSTGSSAESLTDMIQTDAAINGGNSGGPLVNAAGEVIGINTATSTNADGIGFAIPISSVKGMLKEVLENNKADRAYIGIYYLNITPDLATSLNLPVSQGAYVYSNQQYSPIISGGPADKAGIKDKDIITAVNGVKIGSSSSLSSLLGEYRPGDTVQLTVLRDQKETGIKVTLGSYNEINTKTTTNKN